MRYLPGGRLSDKPAKAHIAASPSATPTGPRPGRPSASGNGANLPASPENPVAATQSRSAGGALSRQAASSDLDTATSGTAPVLSSVSEKAMEVPRDRALSQLRRSGHNGVSGNPS